ncbi:MAG: 2-amino-4-hydroxy-6-hydroxymethyldihydropteridine diphosphokinase [Ignavibacteriae bacterium]|nr:2-amino-4-hydroxy-6-hydroxymethyldihydropteridine diphosphokinase [Ignavibacteriota bacterium]
MVYLGLGSNIGDKKMFIESAVLRISEITRTKVIRSSLLYRTEPWGIKNQDFFLNSVVEIETGLKPEELLKELKKIETSVGREKREKWHEREIDIDILFYDGIIFENDQVKIPHPELHKRNFVLVPMCELNPEFVHPVIKKSMLELLNESEDISAVIRLEN